MKHLHILAALFLTACATQTRVSGPYAASLSALDIEQIRQLAYTKENVHYQHIDIEAIGPGLVRVDTIQMRSPVTTYSDFDARLRGKTWSIQKRPAVSQSREPVIVY
jgi:hypothetical protein